MEDLTLWAREIVSFRVSLRNRYISLSPYQTKTFKITLSSENFSRLQFPMDFSTFSLRKISMSSTNVNNALDELHDLKAYTDALSTLACTNDDQVPLSATNFYHLLKPIEERITRIVKHLNGGVVLLAIVITPEIIMNFPEFPTKEEATRNARLCYKTQCEQGYIFDNGQWIGGDLPESLRLWNQIMLDERIANEQKEGQ